MTFDITIWLIVSYNLNEEQVGYSIIQFQIFLFVLVMVTVHLWELKPLEVSILTMCLSFGTLQ